MSHRKSSRVSVAGLSVISSKESEKMEDDLELKKNSRFYNQPRKVKKGNKANGNINGKGKGHKLWQHKKEDEKISTTSIPQKQPHKNVMHIERMHKEIEAKYAAAIDKIGELVVHNECVVEPIV